MSPSPPSYSTLLPSSSLFFPPSPFSCALLMIFPLCFFPNGPQQVTTDSFFYYFSLSILVESYNHKGRHPHMHCPATLQFIISEFPSDSITLTHVQIIRGPKAVLFASLFSPSPMISLFFPFLESFITTWHLLLFGCHYLRCLPAPLRLHDALYYPDGSSRFDYWPSILATRRQGAMSWPVHPLVPPARPSCWTLGHLQTGPIFFPFGCGFRPTNRCDSGRRWHGTAALAASMILWCFSVQLVPPGCISSRHSESTYGHNPGTSSGDLIVGPCSTFFSVEPKVRFTNPSALFFRTPRVLFFHDCRPLSRPDRSTGQPTKKDKREPEQKKHTTFVGRATTVFTLTGHLGLPINETAH